MHLQTAAQLLSELQSQEHQVSVVRERLDGQCQPAILLEEVCRLEVRLWRNAECVHVHVSMLTGVSGCVGCAGGSLDLPTRPAAAAEERAVSAESVPQADPESVRAGGARPRASVL